MRAFDRQRERGEVYGVRSCFGRVPEACPGLASAARRRAFALVPALLLLGGCGQRGALFLPEEEVETEESRGAPTPVSAA
jgi:hypothetical protein